METLQPTYRILWGSMGESNALNIAKSMGFDERIIEQAVLWVNKLRPDKQQEQKGLLYRSLIEERDRLESQAIEAASLHSDIMIIYNEVSFWYFSWGFSSLSHSYIRGTNEREGPNFFAIVECI